MAFLGFNSFPSGFICVPWLERDPEIFRSLHLECVQLPHVHHFENSSVSLFLFLQLDFIFHLKNVGVKNVIEYPDVAEFLAPHCHFS